MPPQAEAPAPRTGRRRGQPRRPRREPEPDAPAAGGAPRPGTPRPGNNPFASNQGMQRPGAPRPGNNPFASTQGMQRPADARDGIPRPAPRAPARRAPARRVPAGARCGSSRRGPSRWCRRRRSSRLVPVAASVPAAPQAVARNFGPNRAAGGGGRGRGPGGGTAGAFGRGGGKSKARKSKRTKRAEFELREAPSLGGVSVPRGDGKTVIRLRRGASITDFADKIDTSPGNLVTVLFHLGQMATATESLDEATFEMLGDELGFKIQMVSPEDEDRELLAGFDIDLDQELEDEDDEDLASTSAGRHRHGSRRPR